MSSNLARLWCAPNTSVCGNGAIEVTEACDDGNANSCDGCSATCQVEGLRQRRRRVQRVRPTVRWRNTGQRLQRDLHRDPAGAAHPRRRREGPRLRLRVGDVARHAAHHRHRGLPRTRLIHCTDNDPACDFDPTPGTCRFRVWGCTGGDTAPRVQRLDP
ncbi:MAG: hypothetical protein U1E86_28340 [Burkholderiaceae bacterium]